MFHSVISCRGEKDEHDLVRVIFASQWNNARVPVMGTSPVQSVRRVMELIRSLRGSPCLQKKELDLGGSERLELGR